MPIAKFLLEAHVRLFLDPKIWEIFIVAFKKNALESL